MRSLSDAGLTSLPRFVKATEVDGRPFAIISARVNPNGYNGQREIVYTLEILDFAERGPLFYDENEQPVGPMVSWSASPTPSREAHAEYFLSNREPLGPCEFQFVASRSGNPFASIVDYVAYETEAAPAPSLPTPSTRPANGVTRPAPGTARARRQAERQPAPPAADDDLDDLPF